MFTQLSTYFAIYRSAALTKVSYFRTTTVRYSMQRQWPAVLISQVRDRHILFTDRKFKSILRIWGALQ